MVRLGPNDSCVCWIGAITGNGYGSINFDGQRLGAHRLAYMLLVQKSILPLASELQNFRLRRATGVFLFSSSCISDACNAAIRFVAGDPFCRGMPETSQAMATPLLKPLFRHKTARCNRPVQVAYQTLATPPSVLLLGTLFVEECPKHRKPWQLRY
ncbi:unnamed protein product [Clavelina lepadiformis]